MKAENALRRKIMRVLNKHRMGLTPEATAHHIGHANSIMTTKVLGDLTSAGLAEHVGRNHDGRFVWGITSAGIGWLQSQATQASQEPAAAQQAAGNSHQVHQLEQQVAGPRRIINSVMPTIKPTAWRQTQRDPVRPGAMDAARLPSLMSGRRVAPPTSGGSQP